jgi:hypothetical protein
MYENTIIVLNVRVFFTQVWMLLKKMSAETIKPIKIDR